MAASTLSANIVEQVQAAAKLQAAQINYPYIIVTNIQPATTYVVVQGSGTFSVYYEYSNAPAQDIYMWFQGGNTQPVNPGPNAFQVNPGDMLVYTLGDPTNDMIKLGLDLQ